MSNFPPNHVPKVGDEYLLARPGWRSSDEPTLIPVVVTSVRRKYFDIKAKGDGFVHSQETTWSLGSMEGGSGSLWPSLEAYEAEKKLKTSKRKLLTWFDERKWGRGLPFDQDQCDRILAIIQEVTP